MSFNKLPNEVVFKIFSYVQGDTKNVFVLPRVCRRWRTVCKMITIECLYWNNIPYYIDDLIVGLERFKGVKNLTLNFHREFFKGDEMHPEDCAMIKICDMLPNLLSIEVSATGITDKSIEHMMLKCKLLRHISIDFVEYGCLSGTQINNLIKNYPNLKSLSLMNVGKMHQKDIQAISECQKLEKLELGGFELTGNEISPILYKCTQLKTLALVNVGILHQNDIQAVLEFTKLECLILRGFELTSNGLLQIFDKCTRLKTLDVFNSNIDLCDYGWCEPMLKSFMRYTNVEMVVGNYYTGPYYSSRMSVNENGRLIHNHNGKLVFKFSEFCN